MTIDIASLLSGVDSSIDTATQVVKSMGTTEAQAYDANAAIYKQVGDAASLQERVKQSAALTSQASIQSTAASLGADTADVTGHMADLIATFHQAKADQATALASYTQKSQVSVTDDPVSWLTNQLTLNQDVAAHNNAETRANEAQQEIQGITTILDERTKQNNLTATTVTQASADAAVQAAAATAQINANNSAAAAAKVNATTVTQLVSLSTEALQANMKVQEFGLQKQQLAIAQQHLALATQEFDWKKQQKADEEAGTNYMMGAANRGLQAMYGAGVAPLNIDEKTMKLMVSGKVPIDPQLKQALDRGMLDSRLNPGAATGAPAQLWFTSPADMIDGVTSARMKLAPDQKAAYNLTESVVSALGNPGDKSGIATAQEQQEYAEAVAKKNPQAVSALVNQVANRTMANQEAVVKDPSNPFWLPSVAAIAQSTPGLQALPSYKAVIQPAMQSGADLSNPQVVASLMMDAVKNKQIGMIDAASDMATIYRQGQNVNIASKQLVQMGFNPAPVYNVRVDKPGGFGSQVVDFTNPTQTIRYMTQLQSTSAEMTKLQNLAPLGVQR